MGSNLVKFTMGRGYERMMLKATRSAYLETVQYLLNQGADAAAKPRWQIPGVAAASTPPDPSIRTLAGLAAREPSYRRVFDMPFAYYLIWTYAFTPDWWLDGFSPASREREYREMHALDRPSPQDLQRHRQDLLARTLGRRLAPAALATAVVQAGEPRQRRSHRRTCRA